MAAAESMLSNPVFITLAVILIFVIIFISFFRRKVDTFKDFIPQNLKKTLNDELKRKIDQHGIKIRKGKILIGVHKICYVDRYGFLKGKFATVVYNEKKKDFSVTDKSKDIKYNLLLMRSLSKNIFFRILGMKKTYYLFEILDSEGKEIYKFDDKENRFIFPSSLDPIPYGNVWTNSENSTEYLNDISMKRMNEQTMMYLENLPDKVSHLEIEQAKKERISRILTDLEKGKYEQTKKADDTVIT